LIQEGDGCGKKTVCGNTEGGSSQDTYFEKAAKDRSLGIGERSSSNMKSNGAASGRLKKCAKNRLKIVRVKITYERSRFKKVYGGGSELGGR